MTPSKAKVLTEEEVNAKNIPFTEQMFFDLLNTCIEAYKVVRAAEKASKCSCVIECTSCDTLIESLEPFRKAGEL